MSRIVPVDHRVDEDEFTSDTPTITYILPRSVDAIRSYGAIELAQDTQKNGAEGIVSGGRWTPFSLAHRGSK